LRVEASGYAALLTGDIERFAEANLRERGQAVAADVLIPPHHGSHSSSSAEFVRAVAAKTVVIPVGWRNRYGHPHPEVLARYRAQGAAIMRTDRDGAVSVRLGREGVRLETARSADRRYWRE
jgi:competence protein ComEC